MGACTNIDSWLAVSTGVKSGKFGVQEPRAEGGREKLPGVRVTGQHQVYERKRRGFVVMIWLMSEQNNGRTRVNV